MVSQPGPGVRSDIDNVVVYTGRRAVNEDTRTYDLSMTAGADDSDVLGNTPAAGLGRS